MSAAAHLAARFHIKLCGLRHPSHIQAALQAGATLVGLNFAPRSRRHLTLAQGASLAALLPENAGVAVFQDAPLQVVLNTIHATGLRNVQLHGTIADGLLDALPHHVQVVRALGSAQSAVPHPRITAWLLDSPRPGSGTLRTAPFPGATLHSLPVLLAGGLNPDNVGHAVRAHAPAGVDVASGIEGSDRQPHPQRIHAFVHAARAAALEAL